MLKPQITGQPEEQIWFSDTSGSHDEVKDCRIEMLEDPPGIIPSVIVSVGLEKLLYGVSHETSSLTDLAIFGCSSRKNFPQSGQHPSLQNFVTDAEDNHIAGQNPLCLHASENSPIINIYHPSYRVFYPSN